MIRLALAALLLSPTLALGADGPPRPTRTPSLRVADLDVGETAKVELADGSTAEVRLVKVDVATDPIRSAVRMARATVVVNGEEVILDSGVYNLPRAVGKVQIDCPVVSAYNRDSTQDSWGLVKAARVRLWPANTPWIEPDTFVYPVRQKWFASMTQMANEPVYVDGGETPKDRKIYYHSGLDISGAEGLIEVVAAIDGLVVSTEKGRLPGYDDAPIAAQNGEVWLLDDRGWYYYYSHLQSVDPAMKPGASVKKGQKVGVLGKESGSGGWSHLHFEIKCRMPSGKWGTQEGYAFLWQAALREQKPDVIAVARPHRFARVGDFVPLDASRSWTRDGAPARFEWTLSDGATASKPRLDRVYKTAGEYSEIVKVTDASGRFAYDFAVVQILDPARPDSLPPTIHAAYAPTTGLKAGDPITFKVRSFRIDPDDGRETWDFGDGSEPVSVRSDGNARQYAPDGYAVTSHRFAKPGDYLVRVERANRNGIKATARLHVRVD